MIRSVLQPFLGLSDFGWDIFWGGLLAAFAHNILFFGCLFLLYWLFGRKAIDEFRKWLDEQMGKKND